MSVVLTDWSDDVWGWVFRIAIMGIFLVLVLGPTAVLAVGCFAMLSLGMLRVGRLRDAAHEPFSFCLPGFRESLHRRYFSAAAVTGLGVALFVLWQGVLFHRREGLVDGGVLTHVCLQMVSGFLVGMTVGLIMGTPRLVLSRLAWSILMLLSIPLILAAVVAFTAFVEYPALGIPLCTALCIFVWLRLGDMACLKRGHRMVVEDAMEQRAEVGGAKTAPPWVDNLFREGWIGSVT